MAASDISAVHTVYKNLDYKDLIQRVDNAIIETRQVSLPHDPEKVNFRRFCQFEHSITGLVNVDPRDTLSRIKRISLWLWSWIFTSFIVNEMFANGSRRYIIMYCSLFFIHLPLLMAFRRSLRKERPLFFWPFLFFIIAVIVLLIAIIRLVKVGSGATIIQILLQQLVILPILELFWLFFRFKVIPRYFRGLL